MSINLRPADKNDLAFLKLMLCEAIYWNKDLVPEPETGLRNPKLEKLLAGWQEQEGDVGIIAEAGSIAIGAVWYRYWTLQNHANGYIEDDIPEIGIAVAKEYRRQGVGRAMLIALSDTACRLGVRQLSLSVENGNPAIKLYRAAGYARVESDEKAHIMITDTKRDDKATA